MTQPCITLVTGGARSGKSAEAERRVLALPGPPVYIATAEAGDGEMAERIARHRQRRGAEWRTVEAPLALAGALEASDGAGPRLVDCLTLWLSNVLLAGREGEAAAEALEAVLRAQVSPVVLVTNEVGAGIVPENALARAFRDAAGLLNQRIAAVADEVVLTVSGLPLVLKARG
jgi:adenosylcobinamide kinase/adenosylcobinamide-phosphate guanylyltransferase